MIRNVVVAPNARICRAAIVFGYVPQDATYIRHYEQMFGFESNRLVIWDLRVTGERIAPAIAGQLVLHRHQGALVHTIEMP